MASPLSILYFYKVRQSAAAAVKHYVIVFIPGMDFELVIRFFTAPLPCYQIHIDSYAVFDKPDFQASTTAVIGKGGMFIADLTFIHVVTS